MSLRCFAAGWTLIVVVSFPAHAQTNTTNDWTAPRTSWGDPDLQGVWDYQSQTPLERPGELVGQEFFTEEEAAAVEQQTLQRNSVDRRDGGAARDLARAYGEIWYIRNPVRNTANLTGGRSPERKNSSADARSREGAGGENGLSAREQPWRLPELMEPSAV